MQGTQKSVTPQFMAGLEASQGIQQEIDKFRYKSFFERHKAAAAAVSIAGTAFLGLLSIACAVNFLAEKIGAAIPFFPVAVIVAVIILGALELLKTYALSNLFKTYYYGKLHHGKGEIAGGLSAGTAVLIALSAVLSIVGADCFLNRSTDKSKEISLQGLAKTDSARAVFDSKILALDSTIKEIESAKTKRWGKLLTPAENEQILNLQKRIAETETAKNAEISETKDGTKSRISETKTAALSAANIGGLIATFNEAGIILCAWFAWFFSYKVANEEKLKQAAGLSGSANGNEITITEETRNGGALPNGEKKGIGFSFGSKVSPTAGVATSEKPSAPLSDLSEKPSATVSVAGADGQRVCLNCGKEFQSKQWTTKYCPIPKDVCRKQFWENKTGKTLINGKKR